MIKSCEICKKLISRKGRKSIGRCDFANSIPIELKEEFAMYCDFFDCKEIKENEDN